MILNVVIITVGLTMFRIKQEKFTKEIIMQLKNLTKQNTRIIIGNPGCGKTTTLIRELEQAVKKGIPLSRIGFCSFSVAALDEARTRALSQLEKMGKLTFTKDLMYFKTLHAMAFHLLGLSTQNLLSDNDLQNFSKLVGLPMTIHKTISSRVQDGDRLLQIVNSAQLLNMPIRDYMIQYDVHEVSVRKAEDFASRYRDFKILHSLYDYTDMLVMAKNAEFDTPELDILFIDEAQDLSTLQWILADRLAETSKSIVIAGDDKQSINTFVGADVDTFLDINGCVEVLKQSYRVPASVYKIANNIVKHMLKFRPEGSVWRPRKEQGMVKRCTSYPLQQMMSGEWLVLTRATHQLGEIKDKLLARSEDGAVLFTVNGEPPIDMDIFRAIALFKVAELPMSQKLTDLVQIKEEDDVAARRLKIEYIRLFKKFISCDNTGEMQPWEINEIFLKKLEQPWTMAFDKLPTYIRRYAREMYPRYVKLKDKMFDDAKIRLMTIHAAKGREADNVLVVLDVPRTVRENLLRKDTDEEAKVLYVAVTRAKQNLYLYGKSQDHLSLAKYLT